MCTYYLIIFIRWGQELQILPIKEKHTFLKMISVWWVQLPYDIQIYCFWHYRNDKLNRRQNEAKTKYYSWHIYPDNFLVRGYSILSKKSILE